MSAVAPDWDDLRRRAVEVAAGAYAPYSQFQVGAAALTADGRVIVGCNVENASYGLALCAECSVASQLYSTGPGGRLIAIATRLADGTPVHPCGRCRQILHEHGGADLLVDGDGSPRPLSTLLPDAFGPDELER